MPKFRKKPLEVDAMQWTGDNIAAIWEWGGFGDWYAREEDDVTTLELTTIHGEKAIARIGDWVIREPAPRRFYPCRNDIFEATYDLVSE
jgi:hypothetical protein